MLMSAAGVSWYSAGVRCALRLLRPAAIGACFVLSGVAARAQNKAETQKAPEHAAPSTKAIAATGAVAESRPGATQPTAPAGSEAAAGAAYQQAQVKYAKNDLTGALESMRESYRLCQRPELFYNLAMLEGELHECSAALADYTSYLQQVPQGRYRQAAEQASAELSRECPVAPAAPPASAAAAPPSTTPALVAEVQPASTNEPGTPAPTRPDPPYWTPPRVVGWTAVSAGVLASAGALYFAVAALSARSDFQRNVDAAYTGKGPYDPTLQDKQHRDQTLADVLAISGGALVAGGALVLIFGSEDAAHATTAQVQAQPGWVGALYSQRF
jgi:hypothetical protein